MVEKKFLCDIDLNKMSVQYFAEDVAIPKFLRRRATNWIKNVILAEEKNLGELAFIFCSDARLLEVNIEFLKHDYYTDVITFDYVDGNTISGDIFISVDRVKENALDFDTTFENEIHRILIHGVLHLLGYKDKVKRDKIIMTEKENYYLNLLINS